MTLTVDIPDGRFDDIRAFAEARGQGVGEFVATTVLAAIDDRESDLDQVIEEAAQLYDSGVRGNSLEEAFADIRSRFAARA